ncbi:MAG: FAD-dependent oxidoreductase [Candidatus Palauibacterales bacterium]|nr:FAD-dependent oxidoreductase [Candidatus Palauibacterales bacterium]
MPNGHHRISGPRGSELQVVVVGGGVVGVCCAYFLARRGASVTVLERDEIGRGASYGNAGLISPGHPPINRPGRVVQALRSLGDSLSPLYIEPRWDPALVRWLWAFRRFCTHDHVEHAMAALAPLGLRTVEMFDELVGAEALDCEYRRAGYLEVFDTGPGLAAGREEAAVVERHGFAPEYLDGPALREREPLLGPGLEGGWAHDEGSVVEPYRFVLEMADRAAAHGARLRPQAEVGRIRTESGRVTGVRTTAGEDLAADAVVLATGAYSPGLMASLGCPLPVQPAKGYHADRRRDDLHTPDLRVPCLLGERAVFCSPMESHVRFAGTLEFSGRNLDLRRDRLRQLDAAARRYFEVDDLSDPVSEWCGLRPCTPDGLPVIGGVPGYEGAFVATGHAMLGLTLGPVTGSLIADLVVDRTAGLEIHAFRPERFAGS